MVYERWIIKGGYNYEYLTKLTIESGIQKNSRMDFIDIDSLNNEEQNVNAECDRCHHSNQSRDLHS